MPLERRAQRQWGEQDDTLCKCEACAMALRWEGTWALEELKEAVKAEL